MRLTEVTESTLPFLAGYLAGAMDRKCGTRTSWTMMVYTAIQNGKLDMGYLNRLERTIRERWPKGDGFPPSIADALNPRSANAVTPDPSEPR